MNLTLTGTDTVGGEIGAAMSLGSGAVTKNGPGAWTLDAANSYSGGTTLNQGALYVQNVSDSALGSGTLMLNGGTLAAGSAASPHVSGYIGGLVQAGSAANMIAPGGIFSTTSSTLNLNGGLNTNGYTTLAFNLGLYTSAGSSGNNSSPIYVGDLINLGGLGALTVGPSTAISFAGSPSALGDYRLVGNWAGSAPNVNSFQLLSAPPSGDSYSLSTTADTGYLDLVVASAATFSGSATWISTGNLLWSNSANWTDGANHGVPGTSLSRTADTATFSGSGSVTSITLDVNPALAALSFSGTNYTLSGGSLTLAGPASVAVSGGTQTIASAIVLANSASFGPQTGTQLTLSGDIGETTPNQTLALTGGGTLVLTGTANTYTGGTYAEQGTLYVQNSGALYDGSSLIVGAGGTFIFDPTMTGSAMTNTLPSVTVTPVPEPGTIALLVAALWSAMACRRFSKRRAML